MQVMKEYLYIDIYDMLNKKLSTEEIAYALIDKYSDHTKLLTDFCQFLQIYFRRLDDILFTIFSNILKCIVDLDIPLNYNYNVLDPFIRFYPKLLRNMLERFIRDKVEYDINIIDEDGTLNFNRNMSFETFTILCEYGFNKQGVLYKLICNYNPRKTPNLLYLLRGIPQKHKNNRLSLVHKYVTGRQLQYRANVNEVFNNKTVLDVCLHPRVFKLLLHYGARFIDKNCHRLISIISILFDLQFDNEDWNSHEYIAIIKLIVKRKLLDFDENIVDDLCFYVHNEYCYIYDLSSLENDDEISIEMHKIRFNFLLQIINLILDYNNIHVIHTYDIVELEELAKKQKNKMFKSIKNIVRNKYSKEDIINSNLIYSNPINTVDIVNGKIKIHFSKQDIKNMMMLGNKKETDDVFFNEL